MYDFKSNTSLEPISSDGELLHALACAGIPYKSQGNDDDGSSDEDSDSNMSELLRLDLKIPQVQKEPSLKRRKMTSCATVLRCPFCDLVVKE